MPERAMLLDGARIVLRVQPPTATDVEALEEGTIVIGFMNPANNLEAIKRMRDRKITAFALELVPRISRAQSMDAPTRRQRPAGMSRLSLVLRTARNSCRC